jgi:hypothetical protein
MTVIEKQEPQETLGENEEVVSEHSDGTKLIRSPEKGIVRPPADSGRMEGRFDRWSDATLFYGLWLETGGWRDAHPTSGAKQIPIEVVAEGKDCVAAYIRVGTGVINSREYIANALDVTEQTVSNYFNRVRYDE